MNHLQRIYILSRRPYPLTVAVEFRQVFNLCSCASRRFSFTAHRPNAVVDLRRVRKSTPLDF